MSADPVIKLEDVHAHYGASHVLHGVDLELAPGECLSLMGRNGMGKSTTLKVIMGLLPASSGQVTLKGRTASQFDPHVVARLGFGYVPEAREIFPNLSVRENLLVATRLGASSADPWTMDRVLDLFPKLAQRLDHWGDHLSGGEQQMLSIGRALMTNPDVLLLDEVTEGLAPLIREEIWAVIEAIKADGFSIIVVDKDVNRLADLADRHVIMVKGSVVFAGDSAALHIDPDLLHRHLGV